MRILLIGDYSNVHATIAKEFRKAGHETLLISDKCGHMNTDADISLIRQPGMLGGARYLFQILNILPQLCDYDVVQFINPNFLSLRPGKIKYIFDRLKDQNRNLFLTLAGDDYYYCKACYDSKLFRFSDFKIGNDFTEFHQQQPSRLFGWLTNTNKTWNEYFYQNISGAMALLPEYFMAAKPVLGDKVSFTNLPVDFSSLPQPIFSAEYPIKLFVGMRSGMETQKGTTKLLKIANQIKEKSPYPVDVINVKDLPLHKYLHELNNANIVFDQLYAYSPAMNALYAMALGKVTVSGAQPEFYEFIGNPEIRPIISISPLDNDIEERILALIENPSQIINIGSQSREFVKTYNDSSIVAKKFLSLYSEL